MFNSILENTMEQLNNITVSAGNQSSVYISTNQTHNEHNEMNQPEAKILVMLFNFVLLVLLSPFILPVLAYQLFTKRGQING